MTFLTNEIDAIIGKRERIFDADLIERAEAAGAVSIRWCDDECAWLLRTLDGTPVAAIYEDAQYINGNLCI